MAGFAIMLHNETILKSLPESKVFSPFPEGDITITGSQFINMYIFLLTNNINVSSPKAEITKIYSVIGCFLFGFRVWSKAVYPEFPFYSALD